MVARTPMGFGSLSTPRRPRHWRPLLDLGVSAFGVLRKETRRKRVTTPGTSNTGTGHNRLGHAVLKRIVHLLCAVRQRDNHVLVNGALVLLTAPAR
jgi:hypothetical protein